MPIQCCVSIVLENVTDEQLPRFNAEALPALVMEVGKKVYQEGARELKLYMVDEYTVNESGKEVSPHYFFQ